MKVICISGHAQNGKDTVANILAEKLQKSGGRVLVTHNADLLKYICRTFFGWNGEKDERGRHLLQYVGTDIVRKQKPDFWVDFIISILKLFGDNWDYVIIPDTRFPNEIGRFQLNWFDVSHLRVVRPGFRSALTEEQLRHPSETALDDVTPDYLLVNDGTMEDLERKIDDYLEENIYG